MKEGVARGRGGRRLRGSEVRGEVGLQLADGHKDLLEQDADGGVAVRAQDLVAAVGALSVVAVEKGTLGGPAISAA